MRACVSVVLCARTTCYCHCGCVRARARSGVCLQKLRSLQGNGKRRMWSQELEESAAVLVCVLLSLSLSTLLASHAARREINNELKWNLRSTSAKRDVATRLEL